jgi:hypothetical protein
MSAVISAQDWLRALESGFEELARASFGVDRIEIGERHDRPAAGMAGAYLGLIAEKGSVQIGLAATMPACRDFARRLFQMEPADEVGDADVADAVCEIVNMLAGCVQRRVRSRVEVQLGLPSFFHGPVQPTERLGVAVSDVRAGPLAGALHLVHPRSR